MCVRVFVNIQSNPLNTKPKGPLKNFILSVFHVNSIIIIQLVRTNLKRINVYIT